MPGMVLTPRRLSVFCSRLSSVVVVLCTAFFFLRAAPAQSEPCAVRTTPQSADLMAPAPSRRPAPAHGALATRAHCRGHLCQLVSVHDAGVLLLLPAAAARGSLLLLQLRVFCGHAGGSGGEAVGRRSYGAARGRAEAWPARPVRGRKTQTSRTKRRRQLSNVRARRTCACGLAQAGAVCCAAAHLCTTTRTGRACAMDGTIAPTHTRARRPAHACTHAALSLQHNPERCQETQFTRRPQAAAESLPPQARTAVCDWRAWRHRRQQLPLQHKHGATLHEAVMWGLHSTLPPLHTPEAVSFMTLLLARTSAVTARDTRHDAGRNALQPLRVLLRTLLLSTQASSARMRD
jgi:hypothetical protein